ncbi:hypothetical protein GMRT_24008 [Giardia muris]|uniref:Uncharacterized protein n=1 Tax=Giardia muris TaxID=5742 RepID=A0A4Z1SMT9_GIAMU|nr:hypothetical protein GMRT_24008 [Giardia muris]|eukprot:TNJ27006.1 hypothetical protein GMRT_24008 [Giardia muris]
MKSFSTYLTALRSGEVGEPPEELTAQQFALIYQCISASDERWELVGRLLPRVLNRGSQLGTILQACPFAAERRRLHQAIRAMGGSRD